MHKAENAIQDEAGPATSGLVGNVTRSMILNSRPDARFRW
jgi:hypothetical protein